MKKINFKEFIGIDGFDRYFLYEDGRVESFVGNSPKFLTPQYDKDGYIIYTVYNKITKKSKKFKGHRLLAMAFIENPLNLEIVNHKDGNKSNNELKNLEWVTNAENIKHAYDNGLTIPYNRCYEVFDNLKNKVVCVTYGYDFLMEITGFSYAYLTEIQSKGIMFFDNYSLKRVESIDKNKDILNNRFIKRNINQRYKPLIYDKTVYENILSLYNNGIMTKSQYQKSRKNRDKNNGKFIHNNKELKFMTLYDYVNY